ncbi:hypothetical protein HW115_19120 [Verrucomicrobiaceae bacterium N1E253]|uniref:Uncharacterized protein n=1 Tax=Oceaniferula marina TaxID=2748318 RepID=A0A851GIU9_9BACT|nr:hypothetical protein [Oceaniferula marina]NWK57738.1 hypothetical protein [Oceaniferula marina]
MKLVKRYSIAAFTVCTAALLFLVYGSYPSTGISDDTVAIHISKDVDQDPIVTLTDDEDLEVAKNLAGTVWRHISTNSLDERPRYRLTLIKGNDTKESFWVTPTEWSNHGITPKGFIEMIEKQTEQVAAPDS